MLFLQFSRESGDGNALLVLPSRIPRWIWKIILVLDSYGFLAMLEGKKWKGLFLLGFNLVKTQCGLHTWLDFFRSLHDLWFDWKTLAFLQRLRDQKSKKTSSKRLPKALPKVSIFHAYEVSEFRGHLKKDYYVQKMERHRSQYGIMLKWIIGTHGN